MERSMDDLTTQEKLGSSKMSVGRSNNRVHLHHGGFFYRALIPKRNVIVFGQIVAFIGTLLVYMVSTGSRTALNNTKQTVSQEKAFRDQREWKFSIMDMTFYAIYAFSMVFWGQLADYLGNKNTVMTGLLMFGISLSLLLYGLSGTIVVLRRQPSTFWCYELAVVIFGMVSGGIFPVTSGIRGNWFGREMDSQTWVGKHIGLLMGLWASFTVLGTAIGSDITAWGLSAFESCGTRWFPGSFFVWSCICCGTAVLTVLFLPQSPEAITGGGGSSCKVLISEEEALDEADESPDIGKRLIGSLSKHSLTHLHDRASMRILPSRKQRQKITGKKVKSLEEDDSLYNKIDDTEDEISQQEINLDAHDSLKLLFEGHSSANYDSITNEYDLQNNKQRLVSSNNNESQEASIEISQLCEDAQIEQTDYLINKQEKMVLDSFVCSEEDDDMLDSLSSSDGGNLESVTTGDVAKLGVLKALKIPGVIPYAFAVFFMKLIVKFYESWLSSYVANVVTLNCDAEAGRLVKGFFIGGFLGCVSFGFVIDYTKRNAFTIFICEMCAIPCILVTGWVTASVGSVYYLVDNTQEIDEIKWWTYFLFFAMSGFFIIPPYNLITNCVALELGKHPCLKGSMQSIATVSGIINGFGGLGSILQGCLKQVFQIPGGSVDVEPNEEAQNEPTKHGNFTPAQQSIDWTLLFYTLSLFAAIANVIMIKLVLGERKDRIVKFI